MAETFAVRVHRSIPGSRDRKFRRRSGVCFASILSNPPVVAPPASERPMTLSDFALYAVLVGIWGGSFIAIEFQLGVVAIEVSVMWRYLMAAVAMTGVCLLARRRMRGFSLVDHVHFIALGIFFFSLNYVLIYRAQTELTSGLAAITFTMALFFTTLCDPCQAPRSSA